MRHQIVGFHRDEVGDWVADLSCGHGQHVRHKPPLFSRPWIETESGRAEHLGAELGCKRCDEEAFDEITGDLEYPMLVVTAANEAERSGCLVGFWTQCSLIPPRLLVCISKANHTHGVASTATHLGVHYLARGDRGLARLFGEATGDEFDKFAEVAWHPGPEGVPILEDCGRWVVGQILERSDLGDHTGMLLAPGAASAEPWDGQLGFQETRSLSPGHPAG